MDNEDCAIVFTDGQWNDIPCIGYPKASICEVRKGEYAFRQPCHSAVLNMHAFLQPIRICLFATSNKTYLFASKNTFLKYLV